MTPHLFPPLCPLPQGAMVVDHTLSFADQVEASSSLKGRPARRLVGSYTGLDLPAIMQKVRARQRRGAA